MFTPVCCWCCLCFIFKEGKYKESEYKFLLLHKNCFPLSLHPRLLAQCRSSGGEDGVRTRLIHKSLSERRLPRLLHWTLICSGSLVERWVIGVHSSSLLSSITPPNFNKLIHTFISALNNAYSYYFCFSLSQSDVLTFQGSSALLTSGGYVFVSVCLFAGG